MSSGTLIGGDTNNHKGYIIFIPGFHKTSENPEFGDDMFRGVGIGWYDTQVEAEYAAAQQILTNWRFLEYCGKFANDAFIADDGKLRHDVAFPLLIIKSPDKAKEGVHPIMLWRDGEIASVVSVGLSPKFKSTVCEISPNHVVANVIHERDIPASLRNYWGEIKKLGCDIDYEHHITGFEILKDVAAATGSLDYTMDVALVFSAYLRKHFNGFGRTTHPIALSSGGKFPASVSIAHNYVTSDAVRYAVVAREDGYEDLVAYLLKGQLSLVNHEMIARAFTDACVGPNFSCIQFKTLASIIASLIEHEKDDEVIDLLGEDGMKALVTAVSDDDDTVSSLLPTDDKTVYSVDMLKMRLYAVKMCE